MSKYPDFENTRDNHQYKLVFMMMNQKAFERAWSAISKKFDMRISADWNSWPSKCSTSWKYGYRKGALMHVAHLLLKLGAKDVRLASKCVETIYTPITGQEEILPDECEGDQPVYG